MDAVDVYGAVTGIPAVAKGLARQSIKLPAKMIRGVAHPVDTLKGYLGVGTRFGGLDVPTQGGVKAVKSGIPAAIPN
ncbi:hypothetical protein, partial [Caballeronia sp. AAUFL_F1_KS45]|uniref:hypothetical protein n=1 Tax=Caballeronia sp. AAUFL_F1_KS45 TaxID=2921770 RepID=UPI002028D57D